MLERLKPLWLALILIPMVGRGLGQANDAFANAIDLGSVDLVATAFDARTATRQVGEPAHVGSISRGSLWWRWTAPADGMLNLSGPAYPAFALYKGATLDSLISVASSNGNLQHEVVAGTVYLIALESDALGTLRLQLVSVPDNDDFSQATWLGSGVTGSLAGSTEGASREEGEPLANGDSSQGPSIWWTWEAPHDGLLRLDSGGSDPGPWNIGVYEGNNRWLLEPVFEARYEGDNVLDSQFRVQGGQRLSISAARSDIGVSGEVQLNWELEAIPYHIGPGTAIDLGSTPGVSGTADTTAAPDHFGADLHTLWWRWTAPATGWLEVESREALRRLAVRIRLFDSSLDLLGENLYSGSKGINVRESETYYIALSDRDPLLISYDLSFTPAAGNDDLANATPLVPGQHPYDMAGATTEPDEPAWPVSAWEGAGSLWWSWTAPADGCLLLDRVGGGWLPEIGVWVEGTQGGPELWEDGFAVTAGTSYRIGFLVSRASTASGSFDWQFIPATSGNDHFADAVDLGSTLQPRGCAVLAGSTVEPDEPTSSGNEASLWWSWTAPAAGYLRRTHNLWASLYRGLDLASLASVPAGGLVSAGEVVWIRMGSNDAADDRMRAFAYEFLPAPENDDFADATDLGSTETWTKDFRSDGASTEPGEPSHGGPSLWWKWTAPRDGRVRFSAGSDATWSVYEGDSLDTLQPRARASAVRGSSGLFEVTAGTVYRIAAAGWAGSHAWIHWALEDSPPGDRFEDPIELGSSGSFWIHRSDEGSVDALDPGRFGEDASWFDGSTTWWAWEAPEDGVLAPHPDYVAGWYLFEEPAGGGGPTLLDSWRVSAGQRYRIATTGHLGCGWTFRPGGSNDAFADSVDLGTVTDTSIETVVWNTRVDEVEDALLPSWVRYLQPTDGGAWWSWTAPFNGLLEVRVGAVDSSDNYSLSVFTGADPGSLELVAQPGTNWSRSSLARVEVEAGVEYHFLVAARFDDGSPMSLELEATPFHPHDRWQQAADLGTGSQVAGFGYNAGALTEEIDAPGNYNSIWWRWTAPADGNAFVVADLAGWQERIRVFREVVAGDPEPVPDAPTQVGYNSGWACRAFRAAAGEVYLVAVSGVNEANSTGQVEIGITLGEIPANDDFGGAIELPPSLPPVLGVSNVGALLSPEEPWFDTGRYASALWWKWTAPAGGIVVASADGASIRVYQGNDPGSRVEAYYPGSDSTAWLGEAGVEYHLAVIGEPFETDPYDIAFSSVAAVTNDDFIDRLDLGSAPTATWSGHNLMAGAEPGEPNHAGVTARGSVWFSWTVPESGTYRIDGSESSRSPLIGVYRGTELGTLARLAGGNGSVIFEATAGETLQIAMDSEDWSTWLELRLGPVEPPGNDAFANRALFSREEEFLVGHTALATLEEGEPDPRWLPAANRSVWYEYVPLENTRLYLRPTMGSRDVVETRIYQSFAQEVTFDDLISAGSELYAGRRYFIQVFSRRDHLDGLPYKLELDWQLSYFRPPPNSLPPANNRFEERVDLGSSTGVKVTGGLAGASLDPGQAGPRWAGTVWWQWTAPSTGWFGIVTSGPALPDPLKVRQGDSLDSLTTVASGSGDQLWFPAVAGETYQIEWWNLGRDFSGALGFAQFSIEAAGPPPSNDGRGSAELLAPGWDVVTGGHNILATAEPDEPAHAGEAAQHSVWYRWTAPDSGPTRVSASGLPLRAAVYTGDGPGSLAEVVAGSGTVDFVAAAGESYWIALDSEVTGKFELRLGEGPVMAVNDDFADAAVISGTHVEVPATTQGTTLELWEPYHAGTDALAGSAWWSWTAPAAGPVTFDGGAAAHLAVYVGADLASLQVVVAGSDPEHLRFFAVEGETYRIAASSVSSEPVAFMLALDQAAPGPVNDNFADATGLSGAMAVVGGTLSGSSREFGEPPVGSSRWGGSVWYHWVAPLNGECQLEVEGAESAGFAVFEGAAIDSLVLVESWTGSSVVQSRARAFPAQAGHGYWIAVGVEDSADAEAFTLNLKQLPWSGNDDFSERIELGAVASAEFGGVLAGNTAEPGEPSHGSASLWWSWTAPADGIYQVDLERNDLKPTLFVYRGDELDGLSQVIGIGRAGTFRAEAGAVYFLAVAKSPNAGERSDFTVRLSEVATGNDAFADRRLLPSTLPVSDSAEVRGLSNEPGGWVIGASAWWEWEAPVDAWVDLDLGESTFPVMVRIWTGPTTMPPREVPVEIVGYSIWRFHASAGQVYQFEVSRTTSEPAVGRVTLGLEAAMMAPNDDFADALALSGERVLIDESTRGAGREPGSPLPDHPTYKRSLWWSWTAPRTSSVSFVTRTGWAFLYLDGQLDGLQEAGRVARDAEPYRVEQGVRYRVVAGHNGGSELDIDLVMGPVGDLFDEAVELGSTAGVSWGGTLEFATREEFEPFHDGQLPVRSVWHRWTAPFSGTLEVTAGSAGGTRRAAVYQGSRIDRLSCEAEGDGVLELSVEQGREYRIVVDEHGAAQDHDYQLELELGPPGYAAWWESHFDPTMQDSGPEGDVDGDRRSNLLELTMGTDPTRFDAGPAMSFDYLNGYLRMKIVRPGSLEGWWHYFEVSEDLVTWHPTTGLDRIQYSSDNGDGTETFQVILSDYRRGDQPKLFFRPVPAPGRDPLNP